MSFPEKILHHTLQSTNLVPTTETAMEADMTVEELLLECFHFTLPVKDIYAKLIVAFLTFDETQFATFIKWAPFLLEKSVECHEEQKQLAIMLAIKCLEAPPLSITF